MKPLLAGELTDPAKLRFPLYVSPKYDGIRALVLDGQLVSRSLKPIPNEYIFHMLSLPYLNGLDGEIIAGSTFQETTGNVMRHSGEPDYTFHVFDDCSSPEQPFLARFASAGRRVGAAMMPNLSLTPHRLCASWEEVEALHAEHSKSFEGSMLRSPAGVYKFGRSTEKEGILLKLKNFKTREAKIVGFEELMHNENEATKDALGRTKRGASKQNLVPAGTLGALIVDDDEFDIFKIGTGFDSKTRKEIWDNRPAYLGKLAMYRYQPDGMKDKPRIPSFQGIRDPIDL